VTPVSAAAIGLSGGTCLAKWSFPSVSSYAAGQTDCGLTISNYNSPSASLTVTLPSIDRINPGWTLAIANDNGKTAALQVNATNGGHILYPGSGAAAGSVQLAAGNYELALVQFDGSNFRIVTTSPASASANGMFPAASTPSSSSAQCQTGQLQFDSNYLYACTAPNTWKRTAWSTF